MARDTKSKESSIPKVKGNGISSSQKLKKFGKKLLPKKSGDVACIASTSHGCTNATNIIKQNGIKKHQDASKQSVEEEEGMEWQPSENEVVSTLHQIRKDFSHSTNFEIKNYSPSDISYKDISIHVVLDTNIFISNMPSVKTLVDGKDSKSKILIYVPWMVLQELDFMKSEKNQEKKEVKPFARRACTFIYEQTVRKNPFFRIQTLDELKSCVGMIPNENADDKILQWCLHLRNKISDYTDKLFLLSNDRLFCAKISTCGIRALHLEAFMQQLPQLLRCPKHVPKSATNNELGTQIEDIPTATTSSTTNFDLGSETALQDDLTFLHQLEETLIHPLSQQFLEYEMKEVFNEMWKHIVLKKPPWSLLDVLQCVEKHWIAVFGFVYPKDMRTKCGQLRIMFKQAKSNRTLSKCGVTQREELVKIAVDILETIQSSRMQFRTVIATAIVHLKELIPPKELGNEKVFEVFTRLWERFNFICGTLCDAVGIAHNIQYEAKTTITDRMEAVKGIQMILPLMCSVENAMSKFLQADPTNSCTLESLSVDLSNYLLSSIKILSIPLPFESLPAPLARALKTFISNDHQKSLMENGLRQLQVFIQLLQSISAQICR